ncbi:hypothetical protein [Saccharolobus islandicus]|uniref:Uncharacterized protein n=8 Tax=Saccharolobus islandicus TaxID=43080 RepID=C3MKP6_SACI2|nr:hypothetical protein [Sulfolobus islandicus]ACP36417.1 conserved hypothetical protein [Sulfolobus islandicus L.S.2.15]ACP39012.1 conserved hypothetical protein [Sulfolobus islandicus M.14.25]ACP56217.1 conserved hypothetical protein [Sulfolobus islandicus M.16.27]ACR42882.1 conserved hypothetical protein [Sulfolobus islandicus M.16.4]ADB88190.1 conserved hypothetical protein [Sulfolobus islandicus L.D.8.5]
MGVVSFLIKHRYGEYGLLSYIDLELALSVSIVASFNFFHPQTRNASVDQLLFNIITFTIGIILSTLVIRNICLGMGQDLYDGTIISFLQMRNRRAIFLLSYFIDVLLIGGLFLLIAELVFLLSSFTPPITWISIFISEYLLLCNSSYLIAILIKRPFRSFFISISLIFLVLGIEITGNMIIFNYLLPLDLILGYLAYYAFRKVQI